MSGGDPPTSSCESCGALLGPSLLACPACHTLVHAAALRAIAADATEASRDGDVSRELAAWRSALDLLPPASTQFATIRERIERLSRTLIDTPSREGQVTPSSGATKSVGILAGVALLIWKFKTVVVFALTKGKLLALGLTKSSTVFSMLASLGVYWAAFGWPFAVGLIASIYIHEMGHVAALRHFGIAATAPMFIPGLGAFIRSRQLLSNPREEARVGLAGPVWGTAAALAAFGIHALAKAPLWAAIGHFGAFVNLFNLMPIWQLDGAHAFRPMTRSERWAATLAIGIVFAVTREGLLVLIGLLAALQSWHADDGTPGDRSVTAQFIALVALLSWMSTWASGAGAVGPSS